MLDDRRQIARVDAGGMLRLIGRTGAMLVDGWALAAETAPLDRPSAVVACGMGGSGIGGDLLQALLSPTAPVPVLSLKGGRLPAFVGPGTLVFVCSHSGNTEETLAVYDAACGRGAAVVAVTSGGHLAQRARDGGHPLVLVPGGLPPRAALPYLLMPMVRIASRCVAAAVDEDDVGEAAALLDGLAARWGPASPVAENTAKALAQTLAGAVPVIYAASPSLAPVAQRWKTQLNENGKVFATWNAFPELTHNETVGWEGVESGVLPLHVIVLHDRDEGPQDARRVEVARELSFQRARGVDEVRSQGVGPLARMGSLILLGDFTSAYLAVLRGVDPTPIAPIEGLKRRLRADGGREVPQVGSK